ncbi:MAG: hypothetical protein NXI10_05425 [bacterium]|nr:hypothetical protein [bacterium]
MKKVIIQRKFIDKGEKWKDITLDEAIHDLESGGYWKQGTMASMLLEGTQLWTPFADYRLKKEGKLSGTTSENLEQELRLEIKRHLDKCDSVRLPKVCRLIQTEEGYQKVEQRIISMVIHEQITPSAAIAQIEVE